MRFNRAPRSGAAGAAPGGSVLFDEAAALVDFAVEQAARRVKGVPGGDEGVFISLAGDRVFVAFDVQIEPTLYCRAFALWRASEVTATCS